MAMKRIDQNDIWMIYVCVRMKYVYDKSAFRIIELIKCDKVSTNWFLYSFKSAWDMDDEGKASPVIVDRNCDNITGQNEFGLLSIARNRVDWFMNHIGDKLDLLLNDLGIWISIYLFDIATYYAPTNPFVFSTTKISDFCHYDLI